MNKYSLKDIAIINKNKEFVTGIFTKTGNKGVFEYYLNYEYMVEEYLF